MRASIRKLAVVLGLLASLNLNGVEIVDARSNDNWCDCDFGRVYLYATDAYGPWLFLDQYEFSDEFAIDVQPNGAGACYTECVYMGLDLALFVCNNFYSEPGQHVQVVAWWYFDDFDQDSGGSDDGIYDTGSQIIACP